MEQRMSAFDSYERGLVLKQVKIFASAIEAFRQAALDPQHAGKAHVQIALCLRSLERHDEAVAAFRQALESATFSTKERVHILYLLGQTLESLDREVEALVVYRRLRREDPEFRDVEARIRYLSSEECDPDPSGQPGALARTEDILRLWRELKPQLTALLGRTWESLGRQVRSSESYRRLRTLYPELREMVSGAALPEPGPERCSAPAPTGRTASVRRNQTDKRRHTRVAVRLRSHFSSKTRTVAGEGELRDLSPWGCRVTSPVGVPVGAELECCIFPQDGLNPFTVEGATVRWSRPQEFGLAFTSVRPGVQRQIAQLCRTGVLSS